MEKDQKFTLGKINFILIGISLIIIIAGFLLMTGPATIKEFNPDIFSHRRITVGPMLSFAGFLFMIFAILFRPKSK
jgi:hypothetical protein